MKIKVGLIGFGRMGQMYWEEMQKSGRWDIAYICDTDPASRELARNFSPSSRIISDEQEIFDDQSVEAVGLFALANSRKEQIEKAKEEFYTKYSYLKPECEKMDWKKCVMD